MVFPPFCWKRMCGLIDGQVTPPPPTLEYNKWNLARMDTFLSCLALFQFHPTLVVYTHTHTHTHTGHGWRWINVQRKWREWAKKRKKNKSEVWEFCKFTNFISMHVSPSRHGRAHFKSRNAFEQMRIFLYSPSFIKLFYPENYQITTATLRLHRRNAKWEKI